MSGPVDKVQILTIRLHRIHTDTFLTIPPSLNGKSIKVREDRAREVIEKFVAKYYPGWDLVNARVAS